MSVKLTYDFKAVLLEALSLGLDFAGNPQIDWSLTARRGDLKAGSTPPATKGYSESIALTAGAFTIDLTALPRGSELGVLSMNADKLAFIVIHNPAGNGPMTFATGAANGYNFLGSATGKITLEAGDSVMLLMNNSQTIGAADKEIDVTGTTTESFDILIASGI